MTARVNQRSVLITGGSAGIGASLALTYAEDGVHLWLSGRNKDRLEEVARQCEAKGALVETICLDVGDRAGIEAWIKDCHAQKNLTLVIANAGITGGTALDRPYEKRAAFDQVLKTNLEGVVNTVAPATQIFSAEGSGHIAIMSSLAAYRGLPYSPAYSVAKAGIKAYAEALRPTLRQDGVALSLILPGFVETALDDSVASPKPFRVSATKAAQIIRRGLNKQKSVIEFPFVLVLGARLSAILPTAWVEFIQMRIPVSVPEPVIDDAQLRPGDDSEYAGTGNERQ